MGWICRAKLSRAWLAGDIIHFVGPELARGQKAGRSLDRRTGHLRGTQPAATQPSPKRLRPAGKVAPYACGWTRQRGGRTSWSAAAPPSPRLRWTGRREPRAPGMGSRDDQGHALRNRLSCRARACSWPEGTGHLRWTQLRNRLSCSGRNASVTAEALAEKRRTLNGYGTWRARRRPGPCDQVILISADAAAFAEASAGQGGPPSTDWELGGPGAVRAGVIG
jgi:hypothetical protein